LVARQKLFLETSIHCAFALNFPALAAKLPAMRILALDHGTKRIGVAVSDETKTIAQPLEYILAEPFAPFLDRLKKILVEKEVDLILIGQPRNMDGSYGPAAQKVEAFVAVLKAPSPCPSRCGTSGSRPRWPTGF
jgi:hypothetical protein